MAILPVNPLVNNLKAGLDVRKNVRLWFHRMGLTAEGLAKSRAPVLTGALRASINWAMIGADIAAVGGVLQGRLQVGVVYGRRQEWEHKTRAFYAWRSVKEVADTISGIIGTEDGAASVWLGVGRGWKGTWSWNPTFSEGGTPKRLFLPKQNALGRRYAYYVNRNRSFTTVGSARITRSRR